MEIRPTANVETVRAKFAICHWCVAYCGSSPTSDLRHLSYISAMLLKFFSNGHCGYYCSSEIMTSTDFYLLPQATESHQLWCLWTAVTMISKIHSVLTEIVVCLVVLLVETVLVQKLQLARVGLIVEFPCSSVHLGDNEQQLRQN